jgi:hypothetical protein
MNTQTHFRNATIADSKTQSVYENKFNDFWKNAEFNRFGIIPVALLLVACIGGFAASYGAGSSAFRLGMVAFPSIIALALMLAVAPMRLIFWSSAIAIILDLFILIF